MGDGGGIYEGKVGEERGLEIEEGVGKMGYMRGEVSMEREVKGKKMKVGYEIDWGEG